MITNTEAARRLECDISTVSRLRSGDRQPSVELIIQIEEKLGWKGQNQLSAIKTGTYPDRFGDLLEALD